MLRLLLLQVRDFMIRSDACKSSVYHCRLCSIALHTVSQQTFLPPSRHSSNCLNRTALASRTITYTSVVTAAAPTAAAAGVRHG
jgi:hypothetical protein